MAKQPTPRPMPTTGMPDRSEPPQVPLLVKTGVHTQGNMNINPGRPAGSK